MRLRYAQKTIFACLILAVIAGIIFIAKNTAAESKEEALAQAITQAQEKQKETLVTLEFKDADIQNVLKILSREQNLNIITNETIRGNVTMSFKDVRVEDALEAILTTFGYGYLKKGDIIIILPKVEIDRLKEEKLQTQIFKLDFAYAKDINASVAKMLSPRGKLHFDDRTNILIINDTASVLDEVSRVMPTLDKKVGQVMIEAKLIETTLGTNEKLGINWNIEAGVSGIKRPTTFPFTRDTSGGLRDFMPRTDGENFPGDNPNGSPFPLSTSGDFTFGVLDLSQLTAALEILESRSNSRTLSNPRITTLDGQEAKIVVGKRVPIPTYEKSSETGITTVSGYTETEVGVKLLVTPIINDQGDITLKVHPEVSSIDEFKQLTAEITVPIYATREADTQVRMKDGQTLVIGGMITKSDTKTKAKVPLLGNIPILGFMFRKNEDIISQSELLVFITPRLVKDENISAALPIEQKQ